MVALKIMKGIIARKIDFADRVKDAQSVAGFSSPGGGGGDSHMKQTGMLVRNFEFNP